jgi:hypothetical protein
MFKEKVGVGILLLLVVFGLVNISLDTYAKYKCVVKTECTVKP